MRIGPNLFTRERIVLDINRPEGQVHGEVCFRGVTPWPVSPTSPGIMGGWKSPTITSFGVYAAVAIGWKW